MSNDSISYNELKQRLMIAESTIENLREKENRYHSILNSMTEGCQVIGFDWTCHYLNEAAARQIRQSADEFIGKKITDTCPEIESSEILKLLQRSMTERIPLQQKIKFTCQDKHAGYFNIKCQPIPEGIFVQHTDITEQTLTQRNLKKIKERFKRALENIPDVIVIYDSDLRIQYINAATINITGRPESDFLGKSEEEIWPPEVYEIYLPALRESQRTGNKMSVEAEIPIPGMDSKYLKITCVPITDESGNITEIVGVTQNFTDNKKIEKELRDKNKFIESIVNFTPDILYIYDIIEHKNVYSNKGIQTVLGYSIDGIKSMGAEVLPSLMHPDDFITYRKKTFPLYAKTPDNEPINHQYRFKHKDGEWHWLDFTEFIYSRQDDGAPQQIFGVARDITHRLRAEKELRLSEERFSSAFHASPAGMMLTTISDGKFIDVNDSFLKIFEFCRDEVIGSTSTELKMLSDQARKTLIEAQIKSGGLHNFELQANSKSGKVINILLSSKPLVLSGEDCLVTTIIDVTDKLAIEEKYRQVQKMEAIGHLAGGVAHDFNNLLGIILGYGENLVDNMKKDDPLLESAKHIVEAGERSAALTRQLLAFSRKQTLQVKTIDLNELIRNLDKMLRRLIGEDIDLILQLCDCATMVTVDPTQIEQVIMNLAVNSRDAMPQGGRLIIETSSTELDIHYANEHNGVVPGDYIMLAVTDTGCGMDKNTLSNIFDPFFTTKGIGRGTGLGLSTVYGIIKQSNGNIWAYSEPDKGTTFKIYLPLTQSSAEACIVKEPRIAPTVTGQFLLVVEDDTALRNLFEKMLTIAGYQVTTAANGDEAVSFIEDKGLRPDVVVTDVIMPGMSGSILIDRLRNTIPDIKFLYMSGYSDNTISYHGILKPGTPFIQKPFNIKQIIEKIQEVIDT